MGSSLAGFQSIQDFHDRVSVFIQIFLRNLNVHLSPVFLQTQFGMLLKPPRRNLAFTYSAENWSGCLCFCRLHIAASLLRQVR
jgi:hypothetical protein